MRVLVCGDVFLAMEIGPKVRIYDSKKCVASFFTSSSNTDVTSFDVLCPSRGNGVDKGLLIIVSEKGVLDHFSFSRLDDER